MELLLDANLSWRLVTKLNLYFEECFHVDHIGLTTPPKDAEIWNYALINNLIIVTNDDDFFNLANLKGFPRKVLLLKTGNQSNRYLEELLIKHKEPIKKFASSDENGVLEIYAL
jgi:predicted nuclease of predicted toxin-antitoxin system